jgi:hypothetical protein
MEPGQMVASAAGAPAARPEPPAPTKPAERPADDARTQPVDLEPKDPEPTEAQPTESQPTEFPEDVLALFPIEAILDAIGDVPFGPRRGNAPPAPRQPALEAEPKPAPAIPSPPASDPALQETLAPSQETAPSPKPAQRPSDPREAVIPGNADKQADATSRKKVVEYRLGEPLAAEGLDIKTVRPQWSIRTQVMTFPRSPLVRISFNRFGSAAKVELLQSTGYEDVDRPLMDALYRWRATGEALRALSPTDPDATVEVTLRIRLR